MDEKEIIRLLAKSEEDGIKAAISVFGGYCKAVAVRILINSPQDVEECLSEVFFRLWKHRQRPDIKKGKLKSYLAAITRNVAIDMLKKHQTALPLDELELELPEKNSLEKIVSDNQKNKLVREAVGALNEPEREIFIRRYYFSERVKDISQSTGLDSKSVENRLFRGKKIIRKYLEERGYRYEK